jgi:hypothetical protein
MSDYMGRMRLDSHQPRILSRPFALCIHQLALSMTASHSRATGSCNNSPILLWTISRTGKARITLARNHIQCFSENGATLGGVICAA